MAVFYNVKMIHSFSHYMALWIQSLLIGKVKLLVL